MELGYHLRTFVPGSSGTAAIGSIGWSKKTSSVAATLSFYRGKAKISESEPVRVTQTPKTRPHMAPFQFQAALAKLAPGRYICQVNVVDELGRKFAFARAPVVIVP